MKKKDVAREEFGVVTSIIHQGFVSKTFDNDIGLLKLDGYASPEMFTPVCLPSTPLYRGDVPVWITGEVVFIKFDLYDCRLSLGWGVLEENSWQTPSKLNELELRYSVISVERENESAFFRTIRHDKCEDMFQAQGYDYPVTAQMLCAGGEKGDMLTVLCLF